MTMTTTQRLLLLAALVLCGLLLYLLEPILMPFLVATLLAYLGDPVADRLEALGLKRTLAVVIVFVSLSLVALLLVLVSVPLIGRQLDIVMGKIPEWLDTMQSTWLPWLQVKLGLPEGSLPTTKFTDALTENWAGAGQVLTVLWKKLAGSGLSMLAWVANLVLIPVVTFYLLRDWDVMIARIRDMLPRAIEPKVSQIMRDCDEIIGAFIRGQLLVMLALGILYSAGLAMVGLDLAVLLGLLAGLASVVPYLGVIVGVLASALAAWFQFGEWMPLVWVAVVFGVGQMLEGMVLTPLLVGDKIGLHPVAVIFAIMAGGQLFGFSGVLLALPAAAVIMVWVRHLYDGYKQSSLYSPLGVPESFVDTAVPFSEQPPTEDDDVTAKP